jgi:hypothetical protein
MNGGLQTTYVATLFAIVACVLNASRNAVSETRDENQDQLAEEHRVHVSLLDLWLHEDQRPYYMNLDVNEDIFDFEGRPTTIKDLVEDAAAASKKKKTPLVIDLIILDDEEKHFEMRVAVKVVREIAALTRKLGEVTIHLYVRGLLPRVGKK